MDSLGSDLGLLAPRDAHPDLHRLDNCWPQRHRLRRPFEAPNEDEKLTNIARHLIQEMRDNLDDLERDLKLNQTNSGENKEQTNTNVKFIKTTEIGHQEDQEETGGSEEMLNDDEAFVAWFTDASSDFNNDPTTRCYVNKLYQPMNASVSDQPDQPDDGSTLVEQEDEYLLLCEEINRLERADERQQVQLPKILDDDDDDDPIGQNHHHHHHQHGDSHEDPLDRLQLTTIIESFDSFPSSPLIGSCHGRDPLISEACHRQDKPDSTKSAEMSPSADSNNLNSHHEHHNQHQHSQQQYDCNQQYDLNQKLQDDQDSHFLSSISSDNLLNNDSHSYHQHHQQVLKDDHHHHHHHHHLALQHQNQQQQHHQHHQQQQQQQHKDTSSEISCFQKVSTTYMQPALLANSSSEMASPVPSLSPYNNSRQSPSLTMEQLQTSGNGNKKESPLEGRQARKRCLQQSNDVDESKTAAIKEETGVRVNSVKKKRGSGTTNEIENNTHLHNVSSTIPNDAKIKTKNQHTTNNHRQEHIMTNSRTSMACTEETDDHSTVEEEDCNSTGSDGQPQMTKYRRRTANARERVRMREINQAFERLKKVVPLELIHTVSGDESDASTSRRSSSKSGQQHSDLQSPVKLTKITTLRLAVSYIAKLSEVLSQHPEGCPMTIPSSELGNNSEGSPQDEKSKDLHSSLAPKGGLARKRRSRANSSKSRKVFEEGLVKKVKPLEPVETAKVKPGAVDDKRNTPEKKLEKTYLLTQSENQNRQIIFAGNMLQQQHSHNTFSQPQQQISRQPQQFAYVNYQQQPLTISQTTNSNNNGQQQQNRTLVTPVAVAILGIQTAGNNQGLGEGQPLQILGIQQAGAAQQLQQKAASQQLQQASIPYNLITQQPQQVTFTLGHDMNGVSVLRLAQASQDGSQAQLQQNRPIMQQQPQILATTTASGYNYTTYQPIQISQLQPSSASAQISNNSNSNALVQNQRSGLQYRGGCGEISNINNNSGVGGNDANGTLSTATSPGQQQQQQHHSLVAMKSMPVTNTGNNKSDCNNFSISPTIIAQHLNSNNNMVQATQINFHHQQSSDCSNQQILSRNLVPITAANHHQFFQATTTTANHVVAAAPTATGQGQTANIIYLNPTRTASNFSQPLIQSQQPMNNIYGQQQSSQESKATITTAGTAATTTATTTTTATSTSSGPFEQIKFVTQQFNSNSQAQEVSYQNNEANIQQLVATLTTSIHPSANDSNQSKTKAEDQAGTGNELKQQQQQQQTKRTYRFHNYDGNMITNHLYSSNHDKQPSQQQQQSTTNSTNNNNNNNNGNKHHHHHHQRGQQQSVQATGSGSNQISSQRSRQNSLSSTCSTTSSSSSSLISLSNASPLVSTPLVKSPNHENSNSTSSSSMSAQCMIEEEAVEATAATAVVVAGSRN